MSIQICFVFKTFPCSVDTLYFWWLIWGPAFMGWMVAYTKFYGLHISLFPCEFLFPTVDFDYYYECDKRISDKGLDVVGAVMAAGAHGENTKGRCWSRRRRRRGSIIWCRGLETITHARGYLLCVLVKYNISQLQLRQQRSRSRGHRDISGHQD